jgi:hypothetical protein
MSGTAPDQPARKTSTSEGGVMSAALRFLRGAP